MDGKSRGLFRSSEISNVANRYSSAIWVNRARRSVVAALRARSKQHSAKLSNCLVKVALIARKQRRRIEEVPSDRTRAARVKPERTLMRICCLWTTVQDNCSHTEQLFTYRACNIFTAACGEQTQS